MTVFGFLYLGLGLIDNDNANDHEGASMTEEWRPVSGYEGLYEVSSFGRVRSLDRQVNVRGGGKAVRKGQILEPTPLKAGYLRVCLARMAGKEYHSVHRLVANAFIPPRDGANNVNHKDLDKSNNRVDNLEWATYSENNQHAHDAGAFSDGNNLAAKNPRAARKLTKDQIERIRQLIANGEKQSKIAAEFGINQSMVSYIKSRKTWREPGERAQ